MANEGVTEVTITGLPTGETVAVPPTVTVKVIVGLKYELMRAEDLAAPAGESAGGTVLGGGTVWDEAAVSSKPPYQTVVGVVATGSTVTLEDAEPPVGAAFYRVEVSVP